MSLRCSTAAAREASSRRGVALEGSTIRCLSCSRKWVSVLSLLIKRHWRHYSSSSCVPSGILCILSPTSWILPLMDVSCVLLFSSVTQSCLTLCKWTAALQASLSITNSRSLLKLRSIESVMPSNHLILCHPLFLLPSVSPSIRVFSKESVLHIRWPKYWSFSFNISPSNE